MRGLVLFNPGNGASHQASQLSRNIAQPRFVSFSKKVVGPQMQPLPNERGKKENAKSASRLKRQKRKKKEGPMAVHDFRNIDIYKASTVGWASHRLDATFRSYNTVTPLSMDEEADVQRGVATLDRGGGPPTMQDLNSQRLNGMGLNNLRLVGDRASVSKEMVLMSVLDPATKVHSCQSSVESNRMQPQVGAQQQLEKGSSLNSPQIEPPTGAHGGIARYTQATSKPGEGAAKDEEAQATKTYGNVLDL